MTCQIQHFINLRPFLTEFAKYSTRHFNIQNNNTKIHFFETKIIIEKNKLNSL